MNEPKKALLLVGSPKGSRSTSHSLGTYLLERLADEGLEGDTLHISASTVSENRRHELAETVDAADITILAFPLYVDSLPSRVVAAMEHIAGLRKGRATPRENTLLAISNCGFPEARHNETALAICRRFAREASFKWAGGLSLGGGGFVDGRPLEKLGGMARSIRKSLDLAAAALAQGKPVPEEALSLMAKPLMPAWLYIMGGNMGWGSQARKNGVRNQLDARPYA